jgi:4-hydroxybenzoate polyprenyltransferase
MKYLNLIRYKNLIMIALMQIILVFSFLKIQNIEVAMADWQLALLVLSTICIAAGGYIINDIFDQDADAKNKKNGNIVGKSITENFAYNLYVVFTLTGVGIGFYLSRLIFRPGFVIVFILCASLLYIYASYFKQILLVKNIVVALMLSLSILIIGLFEIFPATDQNNQLKMSLVMSVLFDFATIAFILNFIREIIKDLEDIEGDRIQEIGTLPIALGITTTKNILFGISFIPILGILYYVYEYLFQLTYATVFIFLFLLGPLLYFTITLWNAQTKKDFSHLSTILKFIIFFGILAIGTIGINMKYYH